MCIRLAHPYRGPSHFPAVAPRAFDLKLQQRTDFEAEDGTCIALGEPALQRLASENPVATTAVFRHLLSNVRTNLIGLSDARLINSPLEKRPKGMWGVNSCNRDVKECNDRAALHVHGMSHGGLSPALVADVAADRELRERAMAALDTQVTD